MPQTPEEIALERIRQAAESGSKRLKLSGLGLTALPLEIGQLQALTSLDLRKNQLTSLPPEIGQLQALITLDVSYNQLASLPPEIGQNQTLSSLDLSSNQFINLPPAIGQLQTLTWLDLSENQLTSLPPEIGQLQALNSLYLHKNQLTGLPPEIGQLRTLTLLVVYNNQLVCLPSEIGQLQSLTSLYINNNLLASLPPEIGQLQALTELDLYNNQLACLPPEIGHLQALISLFLSENELASLPPEIEGLQALTSLNLSSNQLASLPPEIGHLQALIELYLRNNQLTSLPPEIGELQALTSLNLSSNQLTNLPPEIGQLQALTELDLFSNQLTSPPSEIEQLQALISLDLSLNQLTSLPPEMGQLKALISLDLSRNQLTSLPSEIGQLQALTWLSLSFNQLTNLPLEIGQLQSLTSLFLSFNQFDSLPQEMTELRNLEKISLRVNPLEIAIPAQWLEPEYSFSDDAQNILAYYKQLHAEGGHPLGEARILVVGEANAGKTKLLRALLSGEYGARFIETRDPTEGIEVNALETEGLSLRFWDFGGQEILHATHRFFLSRRCVYLLVADSTRDREYNEAKIEYWLELIKFFGGDSPVILVASKTENFSLNVNERRLQEKYPNLVPMPALQTSAKTGRGIEDLRRTLLDEAQALPSVSVMLPRSFLAVKDALEALKAKEKVRVIEDAVYRRLCEENGITEQERQNTLLGLMHDMGVVLHYEDDRLSDFGILNPDWATGGVYKVVNNCQIRDAHGKFTLAQLKGILDDEELYPAAMRRRIVDLMKKFELTYELPLARDTYILPSALPVNQPELDGWDVPAMTFEYRYPILQVSVLHRFMVIAHTSILDDQVWYSGVVLANGENQALVRADFRDRKITIKVKGAEETRKEFLYYLRTQFEHIHGEETQPEEYIYSPQYPDLPLPFTDMKTLAKSEQEYKVVYKGKAVSINLRELLDGFVTPEERRKDEEREKQESVRMGVDIEMQERERAQRLKGGDTYVTNNVTIHGSVEGGNLAVGERHQISQNVQGSFNTLPPDLQSALLELIQRVEEALQVAEESEDKEELKDELESLRAEANKSRPKKERIKVTVEGLKKAAENIKDVGVPVLTVAAKVIALLNSLP
ncbi:MAG: leucine-rich repeat domain-containing protein [Chloroflexi bacterium]|nr:leucine-rich repeat domain-containing protein [Chloroflexota bacterium]